MQTKRTASLLEPLTLRMCGDNVTLMRCAWLGLLDELRPDSALARRIRERVEEEA